MRIKHFILAAAALAGLAACKPEEQVIVADAVKLQSATLSFSIASEVKSIGVEANVDWTAQTDQSWAHVSPASGTSATTSISIMVDENTTGAAREATLTVKAGSASATAKITQSGEALSKNDIYTAEGFLEFLTDSAPQATEDDEFKLHADIDLGGAVIAPVSVFAGSLDGQDHKVYNYKVESAQPTAGLILTNNGTIKNLILGSKDGLKYDGTSVVTFADGTEEISHMGGVCAINAGTISNVKQFAKVVAMGKNSQRAGLGGIAGATTQPSTISACENYASLQAPEVNGEGYYIGGIIAYVNTGEAVVENCVNKAAIDVSMYVAKFTMIGGISGCGLLGARYIDCTNEAPISYTQSGETNGNYMMIAGVVGALYTGSQAVRCKNKAPVTSTLNQVSRIGGIVGTLNSKGIVEECVNDGDVTLHPAGAIPNWESAGGIVGFEEKLDEGNIIRNNTNNGKVTVDVEIIGTHGSNRVHAGGILGLGNQGVEVYGNTNNGAVSATNRAAGGNGNAIQIEAGGICGGIRGGTSYTQDNVNNAAVSCTAAENAMAGGVVGHLGTLNGSAEDAQIKMTADKNTGAVTGSDAAKTGSVAGVSAATLTDCTAAGSVNGVTLDDSNFVKLAVGTNTGKIENLKSPSGGSASSKSLEVAPKEIRVAAEATTASFEVTSNVAWTVACPADWVTSFTASGNENGTIQVVFTANTSTEADRETEFTVSADGVDPVKVKLIQSKVLDSAPHCIPSADELDLMAIESKVENPDFSRWADASGVIKVTADIDATAAKNLPVAVLPEGMVFDGDNHTITLALEMDAVSVGLFDTVKGTVKNVVTAGSVKTVYNGGDEYSVAPLVCILDAGLVENCTNHASVTAAGGAGVGAAKYNYVSGVVGRFKNDGATVKNCTNDGAIVVTSPSCAMIAGVACYGQTNSAAPTLTVENCVNHGKITVNHTGGNWDYLGGIVAKMGASSNPFKMFTIKDCSCDAEIVIERAPKTRGGGVFGSCGVETDYLCTGNVFSGTLTVNSDEAVDRCLGGVGPGFSEAAATGTVSNCTFSGRVVATKAGGNYYFGGIYGNNGAATMIIDGCKTTAAAEIDGLEAPKSVAMIAARPNKAGFTVKNCKIAGKINKGEGAVTLTKDNLEDWMFKGSATTVDVTLEGNGFNE